METRLSVVPKQPSVQVMSETDKIKYLLNIITNHLSLTITEQSSNSDHELITSTLQDIISLVDKIDNANDFYKIGGFDILDPLLSMENDSVKARTAELIGVLTQNNTYCQDRIIAKKSIVDKLVEILREITLGIPHPLELQLKALFAVSCLIRSNNKAFLFLKDMNALPLLFELLQTNNSRLKIKISFLLSHLAECEPLLRETLYDTNFVPKLVNLIDETADENQEFMIHILLAQVKYHEPSRQICSKTNELKSTLENKIKEHGSLPKNSEMSKYCKEILDLCFPETLQIEQ